MSLSDADLLDTVRRLRSYMITLDNIHSVLNAAQDMDDPSIIKQVQALIIEVPPINKKVSVVLRDIENSRQYRDMVKKFNLSDEEEAED